MAAHPLLHPLLMGGLALLALFRSQYGEPISPGLERQHPQSHLQHLALLHFGFVRRQVSLLIFH
jgi:hypothetical protein